MMASLHNRNRLYFSVAILIAEVLFQQFLIHTGSDVPIPILVLVSARIGIGPILAVSDLYR